MIFESLKRLRQYLLEIFFDVSVSGTSYPPEPCTPGYTMPRHRIPPGTRYLGMENPRPEGGTPCLNTVYPFYFREVATNTF